MRHTIILRLTSKRGVRTEYQVVLNGKVLVGKAICTQSKGEERWWTIYGTEHLPYYNPEWLAKKNGRTVKLGMDHPSMQQAVAYLIANPDATAIHMTGKKVRKPKKIKVPVDRLCVVLGKAA